MGVGLPGGGCPADEERREFSRDGGLLPAALGGGGGGVPRNSSLRAFHELLRRSVMLCRFVWKGGGLSLSLSSRGCLDSLGSRSLVLVRREPSRREPSLSGGSLGLAL